MPRRTFKVNSYHVLEIQTQYICLGLQPSFNCKSSSQEEKKRERESEAFKTECVNLVIMAVTYKLMSLIAMTNL